MELRKLRKNSQHDDLLLGIAAIYKVSLKGVPELIGTGFWITEQGHLVTAWHVIADNIGENGIDRGPIYALQTTRSRNAIIRTLRRSHQHKDFDLALSETVSEDPASEPTRPLQLTLDEPSIAEPIFTHAFLSPTQDFAGEKYEGIPTTTFTGTLAIPSLDIVFDLVITARIGRGFVTQIFEKARDSVMLPFPCFESDIPIYGANSGGPVFDAKGRICGINCSSFQGAAASFHVPLKGILDLWVNEIALVPEDPIPRRRSVAELGLAKRMHFEPPLTKVFFPLWLRVLLWPYHLFLNLRSHIVWKLHRSQEQQQKP